MTFFKEYTVSIVTVSLLAILMENILPADANKKYVETLIGLLVLSVILKPLVHLPFYEKTFVVPNPAFEELTDITPKTSSFIAESFQRNLELAITEDVYANHKTVISCRVLAKTDEAGQILGIEKVTVKPPDTEIANYIAEKYGLEADILAQTD